MHTHTHAQKLEIVLMVMAQDSTGLLECLFLQCLTISTKNETVWTGQVLILFQIEPVCVCKRVSYYIKRSN